MKQRPEQARLPNIPNPALHARLRAQAGPGGVMSYRDFTAEALYAPGLGYYARPEAMRVGRRPGRDFYTSSSLAGGTFGKLLQAAAINLLAPAAASDYALIELGAEPGAGVFGENAGPFARVEARHLGDALTPPAQAVVFANEWLDAQPFHRFAFRRGKWRELGVRMGGEALAEVELPEFSATAQILRDDLPKTAPEEYHLDLSLDAENRLRELATASWKGLLLLADYGHDWAGLITERPGGTARAYFRHQLSGDLLARPGEQDLTCHVCWDRLEKILRESGFENVTVERQEAFFMRQATAAIEALAADSNAQRTLMELLHPAHLGHKFQILSARKL